MVILRKSVPGLSQAPLARFVARAVRASGLRGGVNVLVTSAQELRALNRRFRGQDQPTDVLSFPAAPLSDQAFVGDIAIAAEIALRNARLLGHSAAEEIKILTLHGMLHLAGYDHEQDHGEMARKEETLRRALGLPSALIKRTAAAPRPTQKIRKKPRPRTTRPTKTRRGRSPQKPAPALTP
jgi:probable rRNA maturation factor